MPQRIYSRPDKLDHADTILYEIDMLRFSAGRLLEGEFKNARDTWVYLESFLLHFRNLIEFFGKKGPSDTNLHIKTLWRRAHLPAPPDVDDIYIKGRELFQRYEPKDADGGGRVSQYLQHCTTKRVDFKKWRVDTMSQEIEVLVTRVERYLRPGNQILPPAAAAKFDDQFSASTTVATHIAVSAVLDFDSSVFRNTPLKKS